MRIECAVDWISSMHAFLFYLLFFSILYVSIKSFHEFKWKLFPVLFISNAQPICRVSNIQWTRFLNQIINCRSPSKTCRENWKEKPLSMFISFYTTLFPVFLSFFALHISVFLFQSRINKCSSLLRLDIVPGCVSLIWKRIHFAPVSRWELARDTNRNISLPNHSIPIK